MTVVCRTDISIFVCMSQHETSYSKKTGCSNDGRGFCLSAITLTVITVFASSSRQAAERLVKKKENVHDAALPKLFLRQYPPYSATKRSQARSCV